MNNISFLSSPAKTKGATPDRAKHGYMQQEAMEFAQPSWKCKFVMLSQSLVE